jgi:hypothetical protein
VPEFLGAMESILRKSYGYYPMRFLFALVDPECQ